MPLVVGKNTRFGSDGEQWQVVRKLGEGQFAEVWEVIDLQGREHKYAAKIEKRRETKTIKGEYKVLKRIQHARPRICEVLETGEFDGRFYMIMELLGRNLAEARKDVAGRSEPPPSVKGIALSTLSAIEAVHASGYIHRDVKPANFAASLSAHEPDRVTEQDGLWVLIDFGLARRYTDDSGAVLPPRQDASFRGSTTYASVHAHMDLDLGRRDDLWSWLYMMVEVTDGTLLWRTEREEATSKDQVLRLKQQCWEHPEMMTQTGPMPEPLLHVAEYLKQLAFEDEPDYQLIRNHLAQLPEQLGHEYQQLPWSMPAAAEEDNSQHAGPSGGYCPSPPPKRPHGGADGADQPSKRSRPNGHPAQPPLPASDDGWNGHHGQPPLPTGPSASPLPDAAERHHHHSHHHHIHIHQDTSVQDATAAAAAAGPRPSGGLDSERVSHVTDYVRHLMQGSISPEASQVLGLIMKLNPVEGLGAVALLTQSLVRNTTTPSLPFVVSMLEDLSAFVMDSARRARTRLLESAQN